MFMFNGKSHKIVTKSFYNKNKHALIQMVSSEVNEFIKTNYNKYYDDIIRYCIKHSALTLDDFKLHCISQFGNLKKFKSRTNAFVHDTLDCKYFNGSPFRGKKRPDHSAKLKGKSNILNKKENWTETRKEYHKYMNSAEWRRKVLIKKGFHVHMLTDSEVDDLYSNYIKTRNISDEYKRNKIQTVISHPKYSLFFDISQLRLELESNLDLAYKKVNSVVSTVAMKDVNNMMGHPSFKRTRISCNLPKCLNQSDFNTRSSYETDFIENCILANIDLIDNWEYEPILTLSNGERYLPDFLIIQNGIRYFIELKGYIRNHIHLASMITKLALVPGLIFIDNNKKIDFNKLNNYIDMEFYKKTHEPLVIFDNKDDCIKSTRTDIIESLSIDTIFINKTIFLYTIDPDWKFVYLYMFLNNKCIGYLTHDILSNELFYINDQYIKPAFKEIFLNEYRSNMDELNLLNQKLLLNVKNY